LKQVGRPIETVFFAACLFALTLGAACDDPAVPVDTDLAQAPPVDLGGPAPPAIVERSLFYSDAALLDDPAGPQLARVLRIIAPDDHGGRLFDAWFRRFASTAHSERAGPVQLLDAFAAAHGGDPASWDLRQLPFKATGVHNRIDLALLSAGGHCGELRISYASTDPIYQPLHLLFLFRQPLAPGDVAPDGRVTCAATARRWLALSGADAAGFSAMRAAFLDEALTRERFFMAETVEFTVSPWEWRQWVKVPDPSGQLPFVLDNQPLFETAEPSFLNPAGPLRDDFLAWVAANAAKLAARRIEIPERFRAPSTRVVQGPPRPPLSLDGLDPGVAAAYPTLRQQIEIAGCPTCHTTDADFVQTRPDRTVSPFYMRELEARRAHLDALARSEAMQPPFGPLQADPKLPE
jgi:hypothetical protein